MFAADQLLKATKGRLFGVPGRVITGGICIDSRAIRPGDIFLAIKGNNFDGHDFIAEALKRGAAAVVVHSRESIPRLRSGQVVHGINKTQFILVKDTTIALGDIARFHRNKFDIPVIAVTGSNGKTTTKEMVACLLGGSSRVLKNEGTKNNHIGLPLTLTRLDNSHDFVVLEAGTNHPGEIDYLGGICLPNIAVITNIGPAHLQYFRGLQGVCREKISLLRQMRKPQVAVLNADCSAFARKAALGRHNRKIIFGFGIKRQTDFSASDIEIGHARLQFLLNKKYRFTLRTLGYYNIYNALAAIAIARLFGIEYSDSARRLSDFSFPDSRLKFRKLNNINFIDDTYNSNPLSLEHALDALNKFKVKGRKILVMGDMLELGKSERTFHLQAGRKAAGICDCFLTVGKLSRLAAQAAGINGFDKARIFSCRDSLEARDILFKEIAPGPEDIVLIKGSRSMKMEQIFKEQDERA
ncbi:MAG: UDP-N-acetylmuramoyl-tripeptide--D-alanyl-D-alanine ligase [Candidatus Omnitrophica bacterium]|nr:UDP-N-acetylmuramoyl-tripeptide--D-alanyl-D-alanine ligase [Candidatus Omnitrophota bacterium]